MLELERDLRRGDAEAPDAPGEIADAVTALRLATAGPVAAGPVLFERLDWRPYAIRPVLPIAAAQPSGEPIRLDVVRAALARDLLERLGSADEDPDLGEALDRWELSLFQTDPFRSEQLRASLAALLGGGDGLATAALRAALLLGESGRERAALLGYFQSKEPWARTIGIWDIARKQPVSMREFPAGYHSTSTSVYDVLALSPDGDLLVSTGPGGKAALLGLRPRPGRPVGGAFVAARAAAG